MNKNILKINRRNRRRCRIRSKIKGTEVCPRLSVFRSNVGIFIQIVNDEDGKTMVSANSKEIKEKKGGKVEVSFELGKIIAKKAQDKKITKVVFDRGGYMFHGRVKALADGAREGGLIF